MQLAMYHVAPFGERRQDIRGAWFATHQILSQRMTQSSAEDFQVINNYLKTYLACDEPQDKEDSDQKPDMNALERMKRNQKEPQ